jgi:formylglycine-generating enzyme required for sulfatase activity
LTKYAWYDANSGGNTHAVDEKLGNGEEAISPNDLGLYHMHGSVWEWTSSWYAADPEEGRRPDYSGASRVLRGGSWNNDADNCRCANRNHNAPENTDNNTGFRVCRGVGAS